MLQHWREKVSDSMDVLNASSPGSFPSLLWPLKAPGYLGEGCQASRQSFDASAISINHSVKTKCHRSQINQTSTESCCRSPYVVYSLTIYSQTIFIVITLTSWTTSSPSVLSICICLNFCGIRVWSGEQLSVVTYSIIVSRILYALPAWGGFLSAELTNKINAFFRCLKRFGYTTCNITVSWSWSFLQTLFIWALSASFSTAREKV